MGLVASPSVSAATAPGPERPAGRERATTYECPHSDDTTCGHISVALNPRVPSGREINIHYELTPRRDKTRPSLGTIVALEGGPGYAATTSRSYYRDLFEPLLDRRQLLLVDQRGTGKSAPIVCKKLQSYTGNRNNAIGRCGRKLGATSDLYGSAFAADDLVAVLDHLRIKKVDLYGDSYGTFLAQTFAVRHPTRVRTLMLDGAYFVGGTDPWYSDTNRALRHAFAVSCDRSPACAQRGGSTMHRIARLADLLRRHPVVGMAANADGEVKRVRVDISRLVSLVTDGATWPTLYRELDAAARAALRPKPYNEPLLRLAREDSYEGGAGAIRVFSEGLYVAVACNDYPQAYDVTSPISTRPEQFRDATRRVHRRQPQLFAPFSAREWVSSSYGYFDDCLQWPAPSHWVHPVPPGASYPEVPTLVIAGDLDSLTSPEGAKATAAAFPNSTYVETANTTHVSALVDFDQCASLIVRRFVRTRSAGDTSCAADYHENRLVDRFVPTAEATGWQGDRRRTARVAQATLADVMARWLSMYGSRGVGLQGGSFSVKGGAFTSPHPVVVWTLKSVAWVEDVHVYGTMRWQRRSGQVTARVDVRGKGAVRGSLYLRWNDEARHAKATANGVLGGRHVSVRFPSS